MSDDINKQPDGEVEKKEPTPEIKNNENLTTDELNDRLLNLQKQVKDLEKIKAGIIGDRNKLNNELNETRQKVTDYEKLKEAHDKLKDYTVNLETERRNELMSKLEDEELKDFAKDIQDISMLKKYVDTTVSKLLKTKMPDGKAGKTAIDPNKTWDDYTFNQLEDLAVSNPDAYNKLAREKYKKKI
jgi:predicted nuclease with TOPRIM domain